MLLNCFIVLVLAFAGFLAVSKTVKMVFFFVKLSSMPAMAMLMLSGLSF